MVEKIEGQINHAMQWRRVWTWLLVELINRPGPLKTISQFRISVPGYVHANSALTEIFYKVYLTRQQNNNNGEN